MDYLAAGTITLLLLIAVPVIAFFRWEYGLAITLASLSLINRLKTIYFVDLGYAVVTAETAFLLLLLIVWRIRVGKRPERFDPYLMGPVFWLIVSGVVSLLCCSLDTRVSLRLLICGVIEPIVLFYLIINNLKGISQVKLVVYALIVSATFATGYGLWQVFLKTIATGDVFSYRIVSTYYTAAIFGEILLLSLPLVVVTRTSLQKPRLAVSLLLDILVGCMIFAIVAIQARSAWLGLIVSLSVLMFNKEIRSYLLYRLIPVGLIVMVIKHDAILSLFASRPMRLRDFGDLATSPGQHLIAWKTAVVMIMDNPIGIGLGMFKHIWPIYQPQNTPFPLDAAHNLLLDIGVEMGVIGLLSFIWIVIASARNGIRLIRTSTDPYVARLGLGILSCLAGYFAHALAGGAELAHNVRNVIDPLGSPIATGMLVFWSLLGCLYILGKSGKTVAEPLLLGAGPNEGYVSNRSVCG